jgi:hypothetical protein
VSSAQTRAKSFFAGRIAAQAQAEGQPLSEDERWMLRFSESDPDFVVDPARVERLDATISNSDYEAKIAGLLERAYEQDTKIDTAAALKYRQASDTLHQGDHYLLIMIDRAIGDRLGRGAGSTPSGAARSAGRAVEVVVGGVLWLLLPVPLLGIVAMAVLILSGRVRDGLIGLLGLPIATFLGWFCAVVGWRLITGRRPSSGRLMPAWLLYLGAFLGTMTAARNALLGPEFVRKDLNTVSTELSKSLHGRRPKDPR